jgi:hypothetical protein
MPLKLSEVGKILKTLNRFEGIKEFNSSLPVKIEVKQQLSPIRYLIKLGNREVETKTDIPLKTGEKFIAEITEKNSIIQIRNLRKFPKILEILDKITLSKEVFDTKKESITNHIVHSQDKTEFLFFANLLLAKEKNIEHLIIQGERKKSLMQYRYTKNFVEFYAVFNHLGELNGTITLQKLRIFSPFYSTIKLMETFKNEFDLEVEIERKNTKPLFEFSEKLLDIKV